MMDADITDAALLRSVDPSDLATYLRSHGWEAEDVPGGGLWSLNSETASAQLLVPGSSAMRGYVGFVRDALHTLTDVEGRTQLEILDQVRAVSKDIQYIRTVPSTESGTIPLSDGVHAFDSGSSKLTGQG